MLFKKLVEKRIGIVKESQVTLSVREGGNLWGIEVLTHLKIDILLTF